MSPGDPFELLLFCPWRLACIAALTLSAAAAFVETLKFAKLVSVKDHVLN